MEIDKITQAGFRVKGDNNNYGRIRVNKCMSLLAVNAGLEICPRRQLSFESFSSRETRRHASKFLEKENR